MSDTPAGNLKWVLIPAALTLVITGVRAWGEVQGMDRALFGAEPGGSAEPNGAPSLVGIYWLMPILGVYFAARLRRCGGSPGHRGKALLFALLGFVLFTGSFAIGIWLLGTEENNPGFLWFLTVQVVVGVGAVLICRAGWPELFRMTLSYGLLARLPIVVLTYVLCFADTGTHYEKLAPLAPSDLGVFERATWLSLAQLGLWIPITVLTGGILGSMTAFLVPAKRA